MSYPSIADGILAEARTLFPTPSSPYLPSDVEVYDGEVTGIPPNRYVMLFIGEGLRSSSTVDGSSRDLSGDFQATTVASNPGSAGTVAGMTRWLQKRVRDRFTDLKIQVDGLECGPIQHTLSQRPAVDESVADRHVVFAVDEFAVLADRL